MPATAKSAKKLLPVTKELNACEKKKRFVKEIY